MGDWLGTGYIANGRRQFLPYEEARAFVRGLGLKNLGEWKVYRASGRKPANIPSNPNRTYKSDFKNMGDWLGTGTVATKERAYLPYEEARAFVRGLGLKSGKEWEAYCVSGRKPENIPTAPRQVYAGAFLSMPDWLGTGKRAPGRNFLPFEEARAFVRGLGLRTVEDWQSFCQSDQRPSTIPSNPWTFYAGEFRGMGDWLGKASIEYLPFEEARAFVRGLGLGTGDEWSSYCKSGQKPASIPANPGVTRTIS